ncbi:MAG: protein kinase, partial [Verrucomicrobiota bacterium]
MPSLRSSSLSPGSEGPDPRELIERALMGGQEAEDLGLDELSGQLPGFQFLELIGEGGMGRVFRAHQESLERDVAIKVLRPSNSLENLFLESAERFKQEARTMARLQHPHIATVFDFGVTEQGLFFLVMEWVTGGDLADRLVEGAMPAGEVLRLGREISSA